MNSSNSDILVQLEDSKKVQSTLTLRIRELFSILRASFDDSIPSVVEEVPLRESELLNCQKQLAMVDKEIHFLQSLLGRSNDTTHPITHTNDSNVVEKQLQVSLKLPPFCVSKASGDFDVDAYLDIFEALLESRNIPSNQWPRLLLSAIPFEDICVLKWIKENLINVPWLEGRQLLIAHYQHPVQIKVNISKFHTVRMFPKESLAVYSDRFVMLMKAARYNSTDFHVSEIYLATIPVEIYNLIVVEARKEMDIFKIIKLAVEVEHNVRTNREMRLLKNSSSHEMQYVASKASSYKSSPGTGMCEPSNSKEETNREKKTNTSFKCNYCNKLGHIEAFCFKKKATVPNANNKSFNYEKRTVNQVLSSPTDSPTAVTRSIAAPVSLTEDEESISVRELQTFLGCVSLEKSKISNVVEEKSRLIQIPISLNEFSCTACVDTGAEISIISYEWIKKHSHIRY